MFSKKGEGPLCPMLKGPCVESKCRFWVHVRGRNNQTGADVDNADCAMAWMPILLIENSKVNRETGAAVESFRNEASRNTQVVAQVLQMMPALLGGAPPARLA